MHSRLPTLFDYCRTSPAFAFAKMQDMVRETVRRAGNKRHALRGRAVKCPVRHSSVPHC